MTPAPDNDPSLNTFQENKISRLKDELNNLKQSSIELRKGLDSSFQNSTQDVMENLIVEKMTLNKDFQRIQKAIQDNNIGLIQIYFKDELINQARKEQLSKTKLFLSLVALFFFSLGRSYSNLEDVTLLFSLGQLFSFIYFFMHASLPTRTVIDFFKIILQLGSKGVISKFIFRHNIKKKLSPTEMLQISEAYLKRQLSYANHISSLPFQEQDKKSYLEGVEKIKINAENALEDCKRKFSLEKDFYVDCMTILEYGILLEIARNHIEQFVLYKYKKSYLETEIKFLEKEIQETKNSWEEIYKKL